MELASVFALRDEVLESYYQADLKLADDIGIRATASEVPRYTSQRLAIGARFRTPGDYAVAIRLESADGRAMNRARRIIEALPDAGEADIAVAKARIPSRMQLTAAARAPVPAAGAGRTRPLSIGWSIGHGDGAPGTLGMFARLGGDKYVALSNNHVLALGNAAQINDEIFQPGIPDLPSDAENVVGRLGNYRKLRRNGSNAFDAAYCILSDEIEFEGNEVPTIFGANDAGAVLTAPIGTDELDRLASALADGAFVAKNGRKTGYTRAAIDRVVIGINDVIVGVPNIGNCRFDNLIEIESADEAIPFSDHGDSGSICYLEGECAPFGMLFAAGITERGRDKTYVSYACGLSEIFTAYKLSPL